MREIVRRPVFAAEVPAALLAELLSDPDMDDSPVDCCVHAADEERLIGALKEHTGGDWIRQQVDEDGDVWLEWVPSADQYTGEIDDDATFDNEDHDCSGTFSDELPECEADPEGLASTAAERDEAGHVWVSPYSLVGGLKENPGCWSGNGTTHITKEVCKICGCYKTETDKGSQCHESEARVITEIEARDADSEAWLKRVQEDDGWLPQWLAEYLECPPTTRMTEEEAREWVEDHRDEDELDSDELEHAFAAIFGRRADDHDRQEGLWSHLTA